MNLELSIQEILTLKRLYRVTLKGLLSDKKGVLVQLEGNHEYLRSIYTKILEEENTR